MDFDCHSIISGLLEGDEACFVAFHDSYYDRLYAYLMILSRGDEALSAELVQDVMLKVVRHPRLFNSEPELWNWLRRVAKNGFLDHCRKLARQAPTSALTEQIAHEDDALEEQDRLRLTEKLTVCLTQLPPGDAALIQDYYEHGFSQNQLAARLHTSAKAVTSKLARLRSRLKSLLLKDTSHE